MDVLYIKSSVGRGLVDQGLSVAEVGSLVCLHMIVIEKNAVRQFLALVVFSGLSSLRPVTGPFCSRVA